MKITEVKGYYLSSPYGDGKVFGQPIGVKSIGLVEVHTDAGIVGLGETYSGVYVPELIEPIVKQMESLILGKNPLEIKDICSELNLPFIGMNGLYKSITSAIEIALWDIKGKHSGFPLYKLLNDGIYTERVPEYASGGSVIFTPDEIESEIEFILEQKFTSYKMRIGRQNWDMDCKRVARARQILGSKNLMVDAIAGTLKYWNNFIIRIQDLQQYNLTWIEEPVHPEDMDLLELIHNLTDIPIAMGEGYNGQADFLMLLMHKYVEVIQPDVTHCGFQLSKKIIKMAQIANISTAMHVWGSGISLIANRHLARAMNVNWLEIPMVSLEITNDLIDKDTMEKPGLGIIITDEIKNKYTGVKGSGYRIN